MRAWPKAFEPFREGSSLQYASEPREISICEPCVPRRHSFAHLLAVIQGDDERTDALVSSAHDQSGQDKADARDAAVGKRGRHVPVVDASDARRHTRGVAAHFAAPGLGVCRSNVPSSFIVTVVSKLKASRPWAISVSRNCALELAIRI